MNNREITQNSAAYEFFAAYHAFSIFILTKLKDQSAVDQLSDYVAFFIAVYGTEDDRIYNSLTKEEEAKILKTINLNDETRDKEEIVQPVSFAAFVRKTAEKINRAYETQYPYNDAFVTDMKNDVNKARDNLIGARIHFSAVNLRYTLWAEKAMKKTVVPNKTQNTRTLQP